MTAHWLLAPQTPMFFQGQEFASTAPFLYFADNTGDQAERVKQGRLDFLKQFPTLATEDGASQVAPPDERDTFERCRLDFAERERHASVYALHRDLLQLRREDPVFRRQRADLIEGETLSADCFVIRHFEETGNDRLLLVNFGRDMLLSPVVSPLFAPPVGRTWEHFWNSSQLEYGGPGIPPVEIDEGWRMPGETTVVLMAVQNVNEVRKEKGA
jgi:maltooligosyltrehalose trehalohydrolase